jgi:replicative DNA helicase
VDDATIVSERDLLTEILAECERRSRGETEATALGVSTGIRSIDQSLVYGGLARGHVTCVAAKTSQGKSALSQAFKRSTAASGARVLVLTIEDSARAQVRRDLSAESGIQNRQVQRQVIGWEDWPRLVTAASKIHRYGGNIHYLDSAPENVHELISSASRHLQTVGADLVIIDYLQLVPSGQPYSKEQQHVDYVFGQIVKFARKHPNVATLLVTQMARHEGRPKLEKLYHSAKLEQGSHTVMMIWAPELDGWPRPRGGIRGEELVDCRVIDIAKQKDGPTGMQALGWDGRTVCFYEPHPADARAYLADVGKLK